MTLIQKWIVLCWLTFIIFWAINALRTKKVAERASRAERAAYTIPTMLGALLLFGSFGNRRVIEWPFGLGQQIMFTTAPFVWLGFFCVLGGLLLAVWARVSLGRNWSGSVTFKEDHELITRGPYALVRHPIYTAISMMFFGAALASGTLAAYLGVALAVWGFIIKLKQEERVMLKHFPDKYPAYKERTPALIPFIW